MLCALERRAVDLNMTLTQRATITGGASTPLLVASRPVTQVVQEGIHSVRLYGPYYNTIGTMSQYWSEFSAPPAPSR